MADKEPKVLSIKDLLYKDEYIVPLYQRNYAWGKLEITQLLQDILDKYKESKESNYYIGTLIVDKRDNGAYEIIDGQQRHTTLTLICASICGDFKPNLKFEARKEVENYLANREKTPINIPSSITVALNEIIPNFLKNEIKDKENFEKYFLENVKIIRVEVPKDIDINHYFEIMNNRGEQLEKHEILKAAFMEKIKDEALRNSFAGIWEACSQMDRYFNENEYSKYFENFIPKKIKNDEIENAQKEENKDKNEDNPNKLNNILSNLGTIKGMENTKDEAEEKYTSIIDFSNFLLQVLKLMKDDDTSLDDKNLLKSFGYENNTLPDAIEFINNLLGYRSLFDKYIIKLQKSDTKYNWVIKSPKLNSEGELTYNNTKFSQENDDDTEDTNLIIMCQSMLHVSFPNNSYKNWLFETLKKLKESKDNLLETLENKVKERINLDNINLGTGTNHFIFNCLDYLLWKKYFEEVRGETENFEQNDLLKKISENKERFNQFRFTQRNSIEHLFPQNHKNELDVLESEGLTDRNIIINNFGNLCLISSSRNSKYNDYRFTAKKEQFLSHQNTESLKQVIMFSYENWNTKEIEEHGEFMKNILGDFTK